MSITNRWVRALAACCALTAVSPSAAPQVVSASAVHFLTRDSGAGDYWPTFSPDGKTVLFSRSTDGKHWELFVVAAAGGEPRRFSSAPVPVSATRAAWSAHDDLVAFTGTTADDASTVWIINADGTQPRLLITAGLSREVFYPSWYPDGKTLAVVDAGEQVIKRVDRDRLTAATVTDRARVLAGMPSVSPDGEWIAFAGQRNRGQPYDQSKNSIWLAGARGVLRTVEKTPRQGRTPTWSPDGRSLVFESNRGSGSDQYAIFTIRPDGGGLRQITPYALNANHPVWAPDGQRLVASARQTPDSDISGIVIIELSGR